MLTPQVITKLNRLTTTLKKHRENNPDLRNNEKWLYNILKNPNNDYETKLKLVSLFMDVNCVKEPNDDTSTEDNIKALRKLFKEGDLG